MISGILASDTFNRTFLSFSHYISVEASEQITDTSPKAEESPEKTDGETPEEKRESQLFKNRFIENIITATFLGTQIPLFSWIPGFSIVHPDYLYPKLGACIVITPIIAKVVASTTSNKKIKDYSLISEKLINTAAKIINFALTIIMVHSNFGHSATILITFSLGSLIIRDLKRTYSTYVPTANEVKPTTT